MRYDASTALQRGARLRDLKALLMAVRVHASPVAAAEVPELVARLEGLSSHELLALLIEAKQAGMI